ncbi:putative membrane protein DUF2157 [Arcicella aurantiaca]|uniref:Putative membrane protein DUF2157 n=1 Tax=Arcicella aurantiaca TaxID=591202 RepID=A0A316EB18_9BACT|nr:DUF2157 domain-containing protein [Arcicella aurantiaca]PWK26756.1 putative membrane protein DUF2157 [Arcicella aurantiaca]
MQTQTILHDLQQKGIISSEQSAVILEYEKQKPFSLHYELRTVLYLGITLLTGGLGVLIYQNLDTIGHGVIVALIALITLACFGFVFWKRQPFTWKEVKNAHTFADFALLLGCTSFLILEGYLQFQYDLFGTKYGLVTILPAILFFFSAYLFDHRGVLSMAITAFASWVGVSIAPLSVLSQNDFSAPHFINTAIVLGLGLSATGLISEYKNLKKHFSFTYLLLGSNLTLIAALTGMFSQSLWFIYAFITLILCVGLFLYARKTQSYIFLLMGTIYGYIALTYILFKLVFSVDNDLVYSLAMYYFLLSGVGVIMFLLNIKKILK